MAFRQQQRPPSSSRQYHEATPPPPIATSASPQRTKLVHDESEEWVLFSPGAPSTAARTHTTSTERTPRTAGLSRFSDFGSLDTAARSQDDDIDQGTEDGEELDSLDDGLHAFHEPSEYAGPSNKLQQSADTVLPTHDGLGTFQPDAYLHEHMWQFERQGPRKRHTRRRSSVQRRLDALEETDEISQEQDRRQRIEQWRLEQSKALLEEIERETRRRRRMSVMSAASRTDSAHQASKTSVSQVARSVSDGQSEASDESTENLSFWQRLTRRVIHDLMGIDEDTLSVIFGESLPEGMVTPSAQAPETRPSIDAVLQAMDTNAVPDEGWQHRLLERVARELGILVHQLSEHPGAFSTYRDIQESPEYAGLPTARPSISLASDSTPSQFTTSRTSTTSPASAHFQPTYQGQQSNIYSEASLWGIEEETEMVDPIDASHPSRPAPAPVNLADDLAREQEYWERELDVKMVFNFLLKRFSSRRSSFSAPARRNSSSTTAVGEAGDEQASARRAAIIRQNHPLVSRSRDALPTSSARLKKRDAVTFKTQYQQPLSLRSQVLKSSSSCTSQSTKKSKRSGNSGRNYWDLGGSVGSGSVIAGEA